MDRTLYLSEKETLTVARDGPSIWISENGKAPRRIPARIIGRVVIVGNLRIEAGAITLFTENNIPVTFLDNRGKEIAVALGYNDGFSRYYEAQKLLISRTEHIERIKDWIKAKRRRLQLLVLKRLSKELSNKFINEGFREKDYLLIFDRQRPRETWEIVLNVINGIFREMVISCLIRAGLDPHLGVLHRRHNFGLALDICYILEPEMHLQGIRFLRGAQRKGYIERTSDGWMVSKEGMKDIALRFENRREMIVEFVESLIDDIFEMIRELRP